MRISGGAFLLPASVAPGALVSVINEDSVSHSVSAEGGAFDDQAAAHSTTTFRAPSQPGAYAIYCGYHSDMHGVLVVK